MYYIVQIKASVHLLIDECFPTEPCAGKPCFEENPATCMNEGTSCMCTGNLIDDGEGNCVGKSTLIIPCNGLQQTYTWRVYMKKIKPYWYLDMTQSMEPYIICLNI